MTAPLDLDGLEQKAKVARQDGFQWMQFRDAAMPEAVLALIARVREAEKECADLTTVRNNYRYEHVALKDELTQARARIEAARGKVDKLIKDAPFLDIIEGTRALQDVLSALDAGEKDRPCT